jgi:hypothetical protein
MKKSKIFIGFLVIIVVVFTFYGIDWYKGSKAKLKRLEHRLELSTSAQDSIQKLYRLERIEHTLDTIRLKKKINDEIVKYEQAQKWWYEKINSVDNISDDSAYSYLSDRYGN